MGSRSFGELLLRPTALSRVSLFHTSSTTRAIAPSWSSRRTLTISSPVQSSQPQSKQQKEPIEERQQQAPANETSNPYVDFLKSPNAANRYPPSSPDQVSQGIDDLFASTNSPKFRRAVPRPAKASAPTADSTAAPTQRLFGADWSPSSGGMQRRKPLDLNEMAMPDDGLPGLYNTAASPVPEIPESEKNYPRLTPSYGRKVELDPTRGRDLVRGINMLGSLMSRNKVRADFMKQRYHERPGLKRKRLKTERWRARFKVGFQAVTARVTELTRKGW
jgi:small subunit ribosomal protein MRP21